MELRVFRTVAGCLAALLLQPAEGEAQGFPSEPIKIVVPFAAGGNADVTARLVAPVMQEVLGQPVIIENRAGAGGMIGAGAAMSAKPDGHTLMLATNSTASVGPNLYANWPYDPIKGVTPITIIQTVPFVLVVKADSPFKTVQDVVKAAKEKPGEITVASAGTGSSNHLVAELFQMQTGTKLIHVPYKGASPAMNDVIAGQVQLLFDQASTSVPQVRGGTVRALAVTAAKRMTALPDVPTFAEVGVKNFEVLNISGLAGPAGMDPGVVAKVHDAARKALADPKVKEGFAKLGVDVVGSSPKEFAAFIEQDLALWARVVKQSGVKLK